MKGIHFAYAEDKFQFNFQAGEMGRKYYYSSICAKNSLTDNTKPSLGKCFKLPVGLLQMFSSYPKWFSGLSLNP
jgi:hypothetical protein